MAKCKTLTQGIADERKPGETLTECIHRLQKAGQTMTEAEKDVACKTTPPPVTKPKPVTNLLEEKAVTTDVHLNFGWSPSAGKGIKYTVSVTPAVTGYPKDVVQSDAGFSGLTAATEYTVSVKACNTAGCSATVTAKATTKAKTP